MAHASTLRDHQASSPTTAILVLVFPQLFVHLFVSIVYLPHLLISNILVSKTLLWYGYWGIKLEVTLAEIHRTLRLLSQMFQVIIYVRHHLSFSQNVWEMSLQGFALVNSAQLLCLLVKHLLRSWCGLSHPKHSYVDAYMHLWVHLCVLLCLWLHICVLLFMYVCIYVYVWLSVCAYVYVCVCLYVCV